MKLKQDHKDLLREMMATETWDALLELGKLIVERHESQALNCDISKTSRELIIARSKLDGARSFLSSLASARTSLNKEE
jgi:hypothetical protein